MSETWAWIIFVAIYTTGFVAASALFYASYAGDEEDPFLTIMWGALGAVLWPVYLAMVLIGIGPYLLVRKLRRRR